ncbi:nucleotidyltransferase family protein [Qipengyuania sp. 1NDW9]|uniref:Nucleotidyltransferase family protein n=1 Tax=Qipengyuania xiapuensis TaxID=2867236 RepID=A0ABX8ZVG6_9SPHN|nr:nucleotidyltransferase family protein [Qipengyuania xiapuensis]MBX7492834.1 nucleotidyltransferase family protein [Qipengyuania xiapuensis]QZD92995.1 nucleotidyltransferase family protein [Qipengyuania xiapuensis]
MSKLVSDTAMMMAAGLGKRMRPLTATTPKPMVRVAGKPLIDRALDRLEDAGVDKAVVNVHYLAETIEAHIKSRKAPAVTFSDERELLLETGGGMVKAQQAGLLPDPFFACNADSIWLDGPRNAFADLSAAWDPDRMDALLLVVTHARAHNFDGTGDFYMDGAGRLKRKLPGRIAPFIYTGIQLVSHRLLRDAPEGKFSTNILWDRAIEEDRLFGVAFTGMWYEVGTPQHIKPTEEALTGG